MEFSQKLIGLLFNIIAFLVQPIFWYLARGKKKEIPPIENPLLRISAVTLAQRIRRKQVSCEEVINSYIQRINEVNPIINAVVQERFEKALEEAKAVDVFLKDTEMSEEVLEKKKPLLGVPLTVKECCSVKGMKLTLGSLQRIDEIAQEDGDPILKLKKAGAIPILVSNTPEYCLAWETCNYVTGRTKNPYDTTRSAGGSSGGEGALLASGASLIGVGSDMGGSIRIPAMFNGIFGHKPSRGVVSNENYMPPASNEYLNGVLAIGPMCRYAEDLPLMLKVMSGDYNNKLGLDDDVDLSEIEVFYSESVTNPIFEQIVEKDIQKAVKRAVVHLRDNCKSKISDFKFTGLAEGFSVSAPAIIDPEMDKGIHDPKNFNLAKEFFKVLIGKSLYTFHLLHMNLGMRSVNAFFGHRTNKLKDRGESLKIEMTSKLGKNGVLIYPGFPVAAPRHWEFVVNLYGAMYTMVFNVLGLPSSSVPMGFNGNGMPIGVQVVAGPNQDRLCFAVAKELSKIGGWKPPSS